jgi:hypothetical protein
VAGAALVVLTGLGLAAGPASAKTDKVTHFSDERGDAKKGFDILRAKAVRGPHAFRLTVHIRGLAKRGDIKL